MGGKRTLSCLELTPQGRPLSVAATTGHHAGPRSSYMPPAGFQMIEIALFSDGACALTAVGLCGESLRDRVRARRQLPGGCRVTPAFTFPVIPDAIPAV